MAATPMAMANTRSRTRMPATSTVLSLEPNSEIAKFFNGGGVRSIAASPTATTGDACGLVMPATSWPTPSATKAVIRPVIRPRPAEGRAGGSVFGPVDDVTSCIRSTRRRGLATAQPKQAETVPATNHLCEGKGATMTAELPGPRPRATEGSDLAGLLAKVARGDEAAYAAVYDQIGALVFGLARRIVKDPAQSEEVTREVRATLAATDYDVVVEEVEARLDAQRVRRCLDSLTELQRESVTLAYYGGYTYREVAGLLGVAVGTVKTRMRDGLIRMRDCLGAEQ